MTQAARRSAGILLYRRTQDGLQVLLGHMGGPYFARKDAGAWSIFKGEYLADEDPWDAARREFAEETGHPAPASAPIALGEVTQRNGKIVIAWALEGDLDEASVVSNTFELEWPRGSGRIQHFPEMDRAAWLTCDQARDVVLTSQASFVDRLEVALGDDTPD